jgi:hypothetical protein
MHDEGLQVGVSFDPQRGYFHHRQRVGPEPYRGGLRRRIEAALLPDDVDVRLNLDRAARLERDRRRGAAGPPLR